MAKFEIVMPKLGESIIEATITKWLKSEGEIIEEDDAIVEIATDKVDSEIPSPVEGTLKKRLFNEGDVVPVGEVIAIVEIEGEDGGATETEVEPENEEVKTDEIPGVEMLGKKPQKETREKEVPAPTAEKSTVEPADFKEATRFYSPLVRSIAKAEGISVATLETLRGSGKDGRLTKNDILDYVEKRKSGQVSAEPAPARKEVPKIDMPEVHTETGDQVVEMSRMRKLIADHMVMSKRVSPHVTSFIDVDVTNVVSWREKVKAKVLERDGEKLTFTPIFIDAAVKALKEYPQINASVDGYNIIYRKNFNIGMATALPSGDLIVPVIKNADEKSLLGITKAVNSLANRARNNALSPEEIQGGTFTVTNFGTFDSLTGTPVINQPQVAILGLGAIRKKPVVLETPQGDVIAIRNVVILSLAYDHRIVDGALGGLYLKKMKEILENWDPNQDI